MDFIEADPGYKQPNTTRNKPKKQMFVLQDDKQYKKNPVNQVFNKYKK